MLDRQVSTGVGEGGVGCDEVEGVPGAEGWAETVAVIRLPAGAAEERMGLWQYSDFQPDSPYADFVQAGSGGAAALPAWVAALEYLMVASAP